MAGELATGQRTLERSRLTSSARTCELEERRRYIETVLERIATGVVSIGADGRIETVNGAACRLLAVDRGVVGTPAERLFARDDLQPLRTLLRQAHAGGRARGGARGHPGPRRPGAAPGRRRHRRCSARTACVEGAVLVFDDVTPLIRTQRVAAWRDVARRLAHEIKNPLTPIQLCAERMRRHFTTAPAAARELVDECTATIVGGGRIAQGTRRRVRAVRADAGAEGGAGRPAPDARPRRWRSTTGCSAPSASSARSTRRCRRYASTSSRSGASSSTSSTTRSRRSAASAPRRAPTARPRPSSSRRVTTAALGVARIVIADNGPGISGGRSRQAVHAVLLDQAARQRPRPGHRPPHHRRARRQHRSARQHDGTADRATRFIVGAAACEVARPHESLSAHRRRRSGRAQRAERRAARRGLSGRGGRERRGLPRAADARRLRRDRARHLAAGSGRPQHAGTAAPAIGRCAGRDDLGARQHRVGGAGDQDGRVRLRREAALAREDRARGRQRRPAAAAGGREPRAARARRSPAGDGRRELRHAAAARADRHGRADQRPRADLRRERHRQGAGGAQRPRDEPAAQRPVHRGELRGDSRGADRERAVRPHEGRVHRRASPIGAASSSWPTAARCFSTRSAT